MNAVRLRRRQKPAWGKPPITPRGRLAGIFVSGCLAAAGAVFLWASYDELTCPFAPKTCATTASYGFFFSVFGLTALILGIGVWWRVHRVSVDQNGSEGWVTVEAVLVVVGAAAAALLVPARICPAGYHLYRSFQLCISTADPGARVVSRSNVWVGWSVLAGGVVTALVVAAQRRYPSWLAGVLTAGVWGVSIFYVLSKTVLPKTY
jgi:hypothetical protein